MHFSYYLCSLVWNLGSAGNGGSVIPRLKGILKGYLYPKFPVWAGKTK